jgi:hypothetical protein
MGRTFVAVVGVFLLLVGATGVSAHHSYAEFQDELTSIEGTLEKVEFGNPHTVLTVRPKDGPYTVIWFAASQLATGASRPTL